MPDVGETLFFQHISIPMQKNLLLYNFRLQVYVIRACNQFLSRQVALEYLMLSLWLELTSSKSCNF
jgi:hypothetical protein